MSTQATLVEIGTLTAAMTYLPAPWNVVAAWLLGLLVTVRLVVRFGRPVTKDIIEWFTETVQGLRRARSVWRNEDDP